MKRFANAFAALPQGLELDGLEGLDQVVERGSPSRLGIELRLVVERRPPAPKLVEQLQPPELVAEAGVERGHAGRVAPARGRSIGAATDPPAANP
ncbi:MAG TPA: hypothetical protein VE596_16680 [Gaiellaceae bacterium]|nr:hypothetical protein [Gaiellaceae bacterium]